MIIVSLIALSFLAFVSALTYTMFRLRNKEKKEKLSFDLYGFSARDYLCKKGYPLGKYRTLEECKKASLLKRPRASIDQKCDKDKLCIDGAYCGKDNICRRMKAIGEKCSVGDACVTGTKCMDGICKPINRGKKKGFDKYQLSVTMDDEAFIIGVNGKQYNGPAGGIAIKAYGDHRISLIEKSYRVDNDAREKSKEQTDAFIADLYKTIQLIPDLIIIGIKDVKPLDLGSGIRDIIEALGGTIIRYMSGRYIFVLDHRSSTVLYEDSGKEIKMHQTFEVGPFI